MSEKRASRARWIFKKLLCSLIGLWPSGSPLEPVQSTQRPRQLVASPRRIAQRYPMLDAPTTSPCRRHQTQECVPSSRSHNPRVVYSNVAERCSSLHRDVSGNLIGNRAQVLAALRIQEMVKSALARRVQHAAPLEGDICAVCLEDDAPCNTQWPAGCGHFFCQDCTRRCLERFSGKNPVCPLCRAEAPLPMPPEGWADTPLYDRLRERAIDRLVQEDRTRLQRAPGERHAASHRNASVSGATHGGAAGYGSRRRRSLRAALRATSSWIVHEFDELTDYIMAAAA